MMIGCFFGINAIVPFCSLMGRSVWLQLVLVMTIDVCSAFAIKHS